MKTPRLLMLFALSVTVLLLIPPSVSATDPKLTVTPAKVTFGQSVNIQIEYYDNRPHQVELTFYYGGAEIDNDTVWMNGTYIYQWQIKESWSLDPNNGGEGGYDVRAWVDNKTTWGSTWVEKTWTQIGKENRANTEALAATVESWGRIIVMAEYGIVGLFLLFIIGLTFWAQHVVMMKLHKRSWLERIHLWWQVNIRNVNSVQFNRPDPEVDEVITRLDEIYGSITGDPAKIKLGRVAMAQKNFIVAVERMVNKYKQGEGAKAWQK